MNREQFDHAVRAAGGVSGLTEVLVIGSQSLYGSMSTIPGKAIDSMEVDIGGLRDPDEDIANMIDGQLGEESGFYRMYDFYVDGITTKTPTTAKGWMGRLVRYESPATNGVVAWCLHPHDAWISKAIAHRPKDVGFCQSLAAYGGVSKRAVYEMLLTMDQSDPRVGKALELCIRTHWTTG